MSRSQRIYVALLKAYPGVFRREYGPQMEQVFADLYREAYEREAWDRAVVGSDDLRSSKDGGGAEDQAPHRP